MENEHLETEQYESPRRQKGKSVVSQISHKNLYPLQERVGIYTVAVLSTIGLVLIIYAGIMPAFTNVVGSGNGGDDSSLVPIIDTADLDATLDGLDLGDGEADEDDADVLQPPVPEAPVDTDPVETATEGTGVINQDAVPFVRVINTNDVIGLLHQGDTINVINFNYNAYWALVNLEGEDWLISREHIDMQ